MSEQLSIHEESPSALKSSEEEQTLTSHLVELRRRLIHALLAILAIFLCLFYFANDLYTILSAPLTALLPEGTTMIATDVTFAVLCSLQINHRLGAILVDALYIAPVLEFYIAGLVSSRAKISDTAIDLQHIIVLCGHSIRVLHSFFHCCLVFLPV